MASDTPSTSVRAPSYHHGDLANVLREAAADLLAERGVAGFSLREVARRAGVSHAAPAHHYGDAQGLLTAVAIEGFQYLTAETIAAAKGVEDPVEALARTARAYVTVSVEHPGHCAVIFRDAVAGEDPRYHEWGEKAFDVLRVAIQRLADDQAPDLDIELAAALCWSTVQGLVVIHQPLESKAAYVGETVLPIGEMAEEMTRLLVRGLVGTPPPA